jgi:glutamate carboxypeptidase
MDTLALRDLVSHALPEYLRALEQMVNIDSGSFSPQGVNRIADLCEARFRAGGWEVERRSGMRDPGGAELGDLVIGRLAGAGGTRVLMVGHMDTVFDDGTAAERPFRVDGDRAFGPGVSDMKGGLLSGFFAVDALREAGFDGFGQVTYICNPDEEIGSPASRDTIAEFAPAHDVAFVLEGARANGDIVSARKGITDYEVVFHGRAAHAGVEPEKGLHAVLAAAHAVVALQDLNGRELGVTVNVGVVRGGTRTNVVPERCEIHVDLRSPRLDLLENAEHEIERICAEPAVAGVTTTVNPNRWHRPMEKTEAAHRLVDTAREVAAELGFELRDAATGGASDANTTSSAGTPTIDGLGPVGGDDHAPAEWLDISSVVPRATLLAALIARA